MQGGINCGRNPVDGWVVLGKGGGGDKKTLNKNTGEKRERDKRTTTSTGDGSQTWGGEPTDSPGGFWGKKGVGLGAGTVSDL